METKKVFKVLMVDDANWVHLRLERELADKGITLLKALTLEEGQKLFNNNPDVCAVIMDPCVPGDSPNSQGLVKKIRKTFTGPIIADSFISSHRRELLKAGCSHESEKYFLSEKLLEILGL